MSWPILSPWASLRQAVLDHPDFNYVRYQYADALELAGDTDGADLICEGLRYPKAMTRWSGNEAGLPGVIEVIIARGFVSHVFVDRAGVDRLGDAVRDHPIGLVSVAGPEVVVAIRADPHDNGGVYRADFPTRRWVASMTQPGEGPDPIADTEWATRAGMVAGLAAWVRANLPPDYDAWESFRRRYGMNE